MLLVLRLVLLVGLDPELACCFQCHQRSLLNRVLVRPCHFLKLVHGHRRAICSQVQPAHNQSTTVEAFVSRASKASNPCAESAGFYALPIETRRSLCDY